MNDYIDRLYAEFKTSKGKVPTITPKDLDRRWLTCKWENQYEYLHSHDLCCDESSTGAKYDTCRYRYHERNQLDEIERLMRDDWAN